MGGAKGENLSLIGGAPYFCLPKKRGDDSLEFREREARKEKREGGGEAHFVGKGTRTKSIGERKPDDQPLRKEKLQCEEARGRGKGRVKVPCFLQKNIEQKVLQTGWKNKKEHAGEQCFLKKKSER